jgi:hypothetical protein
MACKVWNFEFYDMPKSVDKYECMLMPLNNNPCREYLSKSVLTWCSNFSGAISNRWTHVIANDDIDSVQSFLFQVGAGVAGTLMHEYKWVLFFS